MPAVASRLQAPPTQSRVAQPATRATIRPKHRVRRRAVAVHPLRRATLISLCAALPLVAYAGIWTTAMRSGYQKNRLTREIRVLEVENDSLQAQVRRLQSPHRITAAAQEMGLEAGVKIEFVNSGPQRLAQNSIGK